MPDRSEVPQSQPGDVGFGYINNRESVAVPMTPKSPLKSAMRVPGTPARRLENPLSPTFREEEVLEKKEAHTAKAQKRDLVSSILLMGFNGRTNTSAEDQDASPYGQVRAARCQLQLLSDHCFNAFRFIRHLQRHKVLA